MSNVIGRVLVSKQVEKVAQSVSRWFRVNYPLFNRIRKDDMGNASGMTCVWLVFYPSVKIAPGYQE